MKSGIFLVISLFAGYLFVSWLPVPNSIHLYNFLLEFIFNPVMVFAATIAFFIGVVANGIFIRETILKLKRAKRYKKTIILEIFNIALCVISGIFLSKLGIWQTVLFFSFGFLYGMMTIEKYV